ncbi:MAG: YwiC-like family protein [Acidimicrobiia bacterium]
MTTGSDLARPSDRARTRSTIKAVGLPTEHGGWGLTLEPALLGMIVAPGAAGLALAVAAIVAFLARTPLKVVLVDGYRGRVLERTRVARRLAAAELVLLAGLVATAVLLAEGSFWVPALVSAACVGVGLWFDLRSRSRRLVPELAGAIGITGVAAMTVLADGGDAPTAWAIWLVLAARAVTSIPFVREQVALRHGRRPSRVLLAVTDSVAAAAAALAVVVLPRALAGAVAIVVVIAYQRISVLGRPLSAVAIGIRQMVVGLVVVIVTAVGVLAP